MCTKRKGAPNLESVWKGASCEVNSPMQPFETLCLAELLGLYIQLAITAAYPKYFHQPITAVMRKTLIACL